MGPAGQRYYQAAESLAVRWSDLLIADAQGIADYYAEEFGAATELIAYGAPILTGTGSDRIAEFGVDPGGLSPGGRAVRAGEPRPRDRPGLRPQRRPSCRWWWSAPHRTPTPTPRAIRAAADERVKLLGALWDQDQIDQLYANALTYWHGHSVGGTNPSLLRAAGAATCTCAYDVIFNREVLGEWGQYFTTPDDVAELIMKAEADPECARQRGQGLQDSIRRYNWDDVAARYEVLCRRLADRDFPRRRPSGRRTGAWSGR